MCEYEGVSLNNTMQKITDLNIIISNLVEFAREQHLIEQTLDNCLKFLTNEFNENGLPHQWKPSDIEMRFRSHSLVFESGLLSYSYISTMLDLYVNDRDVGDYSLIIGLDGELVDDYLVFHPEYADD